MASNANGSANTTSRSIVPTDALRSVWRSVARGSLLLYLATKPWPDELRTFLVGHLALLSVTPTLTLRLVFPPPLRRVLATYQTAVYEELESRLEAGTIRELRHYFFHRRRRTDLTTLPETLRAILSRYAEVYGGPRFTHLYRRWLTDEQAALAPVSPAIQAGLAARRAAIECVILPHSYDHLSPSTTLSDSRIRPAICE